jgi:cyclopropane fatty-acyl-phospholipid synthase-like methyltransferase
MVTYNYTQMDVEERPFALSLASYIKEHIKPQKIIDVGCGSGTYVRAFRENGLSCVGYDNSPQLTDNKDVITLDLFQINESSDLVVCLEVAEHLDPLLSSYVVEKLLSLVEPGGTIIWSAAIEGQGGEGHINCRPKEFWESKFLQHREVYRNSIVETSLRHFLSSRPRMGWFMQNFMVFTKGNK